MTTPNPSYKPSEGKREEFRKYLEKNGVMDALTRVLVNLYEEVDKPEDALEYIRDKLAVIAGLETNKQLQMKIEDAEEKIKALEAQLQASGDGEPSAEATGGAEEAPSAVKTEEPEPEQTSPPENPEAEQPQ